ncbi:unnamed protein product, partial [Closterium sp. Naga37s-1]
SLSPSGAPQPHTSLLTVLPLTSSAAKFINLFAEKRLTPNGRLAAAIWPTRHFHAPAAHLLSCSFPHQIVLHASATPPVK